MQSGNSTIPPGSLYAVVNVAVGLAYGLGLPIAVGIWTEMRWWIIVSISVLWLVSNGRIIDRWIPVLTDPLIRFLYSASKRLSTRG